MQVHGRVVRATFQAAHPAYRSVFPPESEGVGRHRCSRTKHPQLHASVTGRSCTARHGGMGMSHRKRLSSRYPCASTCRNGRPQASRGCNMVKSCWGRLGYQVQRRAWFVLQLLCPQGLVQVQRSCLPLRSQEKDKVYVLRWSRNARCRVEERHQSNAFVLIGVAHRFLVPSRT